MIAKAKYASAPPDGVTRPRAVLTASTLAFVFLPAIALGAEESKSENIGPWEIEATFKADEFDRCSINRTLDDDIVATFVRTSDGLSLELESPNWKLERGKQYPVKMNLGPLSFDAEVAAEFELGLDGPQGQEIHFRTPRRQCLERGCGGSDDPRPARQEHGRIRPAGAMRREE